MQRNPITFVARDGTWVAGGREQNGQQREGKVHMNDLWLSFMAVAYR